MPRSTPIIALAATIATAAALPVAADNDPWTLRANAAYIATDSDSDGIIGSSGIGLLPDEDGVNVQDAWGFAFSLSYAFSDNWALTLLASAPFEHDIEGTGALDGLDIGEATHLPPSLVMEYRFNPQGDFVPYVGGGFNYTLFLDDDTSPALTAALDGIVGGVTSTELELDDSFGLAVVAGFDWMLGDNWGINGSVWYADIETDATVFVNGVATVERAEVSIDPVIPQLGVFFRF